MILYLCRHGIAEDYSKSGRDADRELTEEGRSKFQKVAKGFADLEPEIGQIFTSPLIRARQTAEILQSVLRKQTKTEPALTVLPVLGMGASWKGLRQMLEKMSDPEGQVVAVGHEPFMSELVYQLCLRDEKSKTGQGTGLMGGDLMGGVEFKKGGMAGIRLAGDFERGTLLWLAPPGIMRRL